MSSLPGLDICCKSQLGFLRFTFIPLTINQHVGGHDPECGLLYVSPWWHLSRQSGSWSLLGTYRPLKLGFMVYAIKGIQHHTYCSGLTCPSKALLAAFSHLDGSPPLRLLSSKQRANVEQGHEKNVNEKIALL